MEYTIKYIYKCGHEKEVLVKERPENEMIKIPTLCEECRKADAQKQLSIEELKTLCQALTHKSEKQLMYADKTRNEFISHWVRSASNAQADIIRDVIKNETSAAWWMDNMKLVRTDDFINSYTPNKTKTEKQKNKPITYINDNKKSDQEKLKSKVKKMRDGLIRPEMTNNISRYPNNPVMITLSQTDANKMEAIPATITGEISKEMELLKFDVSNNMFYRVINEYTGTYENRAAETAIKLLNKGYPVIIFNERIIKMIKNRTYKKEQDKWFKRFNETTAALIWEGYNKELVTRALTLLPGARWNNDYKCVTVPLSNPKQIIEFAKSNDISIDSNIKTYINKKPTTTI